MNSYDFEATDFALSNKGVHLLRSRYNYKTIEYESIEKATIKRGPEINNVILVFVLGIGFVAFALFQSLYVLGLFKNPEVQVIYIESIVLPVLPGLLGFYLIYVATKKGPILIIETSTTKQKLRLRDLIKSNKMKDLRNYLGQKLHYKFVIQG